MKRHPSVWRHLLTLAVFLLAGGGVAAAQTSITLTSQYGPGKPQTLLWERFVAELDAALPGAYAPTVVVGGALGGEKEEAEAVRLGAITGAQSTAANLSTWVPLGAVLDMPFVFDGPEHINRVLAGSLGERLRGLYRDAGFHVPAFIIFGARHIIGPEPYSAPGQLEDVRVRSLQSDLHISLWRALDAQPTALAITEAYSALAGGVVKAMDMTMSGYEALRLYEVAPVLSETAHIWAVGAVYFDAAFYDALPADHQAAFDAAAVEAARHFNQIAAAEQEAAMARSEEKGARRVAVDGEPWRAALAEFADAYAAQINDPFARQALEEIEAAR
ncbi:MAG: TRAP transporter substrate-binding protein [Pseudomonadota bacterium]